MDMGRLQVVPKGAERLLRIGFTRQRRAAAFLEGFDFIGPLFEQLLVDRALGLGTAVRGVD
jgi:hypothetical protein